MPFELPELPYAKDALEPHISAETMSFHHDKHHKAYVDKTNGLVEGTDLEGKPLEDVIEAAKSKGETGLYNQASQVWNHTFFWNSMSPEGGGKPEGEIAEKIDDAFGSFDKFAEEFVAAAGGNFASGWTWLAMKNGKLEIVNTDDAGTLAANDGYTPLLTLDVWEHAYYLDYQNKRPDFVKAFLDNLANWDFAEKNLKSAA